MREPSPTAKNESARGSLRTVPEYLFHQGLNPFLPFLCFFHGSIRMVTALAFSDAGDQARAECRQRYRRAVPQPQYSLNSVNDDSHVRTSFLLFPFRQTGGDGLSVGAVNMVMVPFVSVRQTFAPAAASAPKTAAEGDRRISGPQEITAKSGETAARNAGWWRCRTRDALS